MAHTVAPGAVYQHPSDASQTGEPPKIRRCSPTRWICACGLFWAALVTFIIVAKKYTDASKLQEYIDTQCVSPFSEKEFQERTATITKGGPKVCTLPVRSAMLPMAHQVALLGMATTDEIRNIVNVGTRISTMGRECDPARERDGRYPSECVSEHGFYFASLADYKNDVKQVVEGDLFKPDRVIVVISNPFDTAYRIYRKKKACDTNFFRFRCDLKSDVIINDRDISSPTYLEFAKSVFDEWVVFMKAVEEADNGTFTKIYLDDLLSPRKRADTISEIFNVVYDDRLSPDIEDSVECVLKEAQSQKIFPEEYNRDYSRFFSNQSLLELCDRADAYWDSSRWKFECH